jgi:hypothetical protein
MTTVRFLVHRNNLHTTIRIKYTDGQSEPNTINHGIRQGCGLSPTLFNIYINKMIKEWKEEMNGTNDIQLKNKSTIKTVLYADDQVLISK